MKKITVKYKKSQMDIDQKMQFIKAFPLFAKLSEKDIRSIANITQEKFLSAQELLIEQNESSDVAYFIVEGSARVFRLTEDGQEVTLAILGPGDIVGEMALIDHGARSANVQILQDSRVLSISASYFTQILEQHPQTAVKLLASLSQKIRKMDEYIESISTTTIVDRTWKTLNVLKQYFPDRIVTLSHEELALIVGATRARITEALDTLAKDHKILLAHRSITVL